MSINDKDMLVVASSFSKESQGHFYINYVHTKVILIWIVWPISKFYSLTQQNCFSFVHVGRFMLLGLLQGEWIAY